MVSLMTLAAIWASAIGLGVTQSINPDSVSSSTRDLWCISQKAQCPLICAQYPGESAATAANDCDADTLQYACVCEVNGLSPNITEYSQTIPYFTCTENNNNCVTACNGDSTCQSSCREDNACGAQNPTRVNETDGAASTTTKSSGKAASTAADGAVYTGFGGSGSDTSGSSEGGDAGTNAAAVLLDLGQIYGVGVVSAGILVGVSFLL